MNQLNQELMCIRSSKAYLQKKLQQETDPHIQQKIQHYIDCYNKEETRILDQLNIRLDDITLTEDKKEEDTE